MDLYMVDRRNIYSPGDHVTPKHYDDIRPLEMATLVEQLFPHGVAPQGEKYLLNVDAKMSTADIAIDWCLEFYRRSCYPDKPCRFTSLFACDSIAQAKQFKAQYGLPEHKIFCLPNINLTRCHRGDMAMLHIDTTALEFTYLIDNYWQGQPGDDVPFWEYVVPLPVTIGEEITD